MFARNVAVLATSVAFLATALPAHADLVFKTEGAHVVLGQKACDGKVANLLLPEWRPKFRAGFAVINGRALRLCWVEEPQGVIVVIDEDGDGGTMPKSAFKEAGA